MAEHILDWFSRCGQMLLIMISTVWILYYRKLPSKIHWVGGYMLLNLLVQLLADWLWIHKLNNLFLLHLNTGLEFLFLSLFFRAIYVYQRRFQKIFVYLMVGVGVVLVINSAFIEPLDSYNKYSRLLVSSTLIIYSLIYFFDTFGRIDLSYGTNQAISWVCFGILMYYSGSLLIFLFPHLSLDESLMKVYIYLWVFNALLFVLFVLIVLIAMIKLVRASSTNPVKPVSPS